MWCSTRWRGSHSQPLPIPLQQMPSTLPSMAECRNDLTVQEGQHVRHKELQASQFAPHHLQSVLMHLIAMDTAESRLPPA